MKNKRFHGIGGNVYILFRIKNSIAEEETLDASRPVEKFLLKNLPSNLRFDAYDLLRVPLGDHLCNSSR